jgi:tRNA modification GTPase
VYRRDTIAAIATASGPAAVAVVRVSGPEAARIAARIVRDASPAEWRSHRLHRARFVDPQDQTLDHGLAVLMRAPRSYTGEDVLEIHGHGGIVVARSIFSALLAFGARAADRGEFTSRAFLNGRLDLAQAEAVADLIAAPTERAALAAAGQLGGALSRLVENFRGRLVRVAAALEAAIDFSEEDIGDLDRSGLGHECLAIADELGVLAATHARGRLLRQGIRVTLVGKPNAGKSSLLNRLLGSDRAIVTAMPGTTRDVVEESIDIDGVAVVLADTAGIRRGAEEIERMGIRRTMDRVETADIVIVVLDNSRSLDEADAEVLSATRHKQRILLINKADLSPHLELGDNVATLRASALSGDGIERLKSEIVRLAGLEDVGDRVVVTRERQRAAITAASDAAKSAARTLAASEAPELVAVDIMAALDHLGEIVGKTAIEAVLDRVFAEFCIGK